MKKHPDVIIISNPLDVRVPNLYVLLLYAFEKQDKYLFTRALKRLSELK